MVKNLNILPRKAIALGFQIGSVLFGSKAMTFKQAQKLEKESRSHILYTLIDTLNLVDREIEIKDIKKADEISLSISGKIVEIGYRVRFTGKGKKTRICIEDDGTILETAKNREICIKKEDEIRGFLLSEISLDSISQALSDLKL